MMPSDAEVYCLRARNVELEAMVQAARADVERAAAFLDRMAEHWEQEARWSGHESDIKRHKHRAADCRAMAKKLRGEP